MGKQNNRLKLKMGLEPHGESATLPLELLAMLGPIA